MDFSIAGDMFCTRSVATLAVYPRLDVFESQPAIVNRQVTGVACETAAGFRVIVKYSERSQVRVEMMFWLAGSDVKTVDIAIPGPAEFNQVRRSLAVAQCRDPGSSVATRSKTPVQRNLTGNGIGRIPGVRNSSGNLNKGSFTASFIAVSELSEHRQ